MKNLTDYDDYVHTVTLYSSSLIGICLGVYLILLYLKSKIKFTVECWFCMKCSPVLFENRNSWNCIHCGQYNGFNKDGSYNKLIETQHNYNPTSYCKRSSIIRYEHNRLCDSCNKNQEIKIKLLADFVPVDEEDFDAEVSDFRRHLENQYKLCDECELLIAKILDSKEPKDVKKKNNRMNLNNTCLFVNKVDKVSSLILPSIANFFILSSLTYLFSVSFHAGNLNDGQFIFAPFFTPDHVYIYQKYYFHLIFTGLALFLTQAYLRSYNRFFIDITQLVLWITLLLNSSKVNAFSLTDDGLVDCQQCLLAISTLTTLANVILMFSDYFRGYRKMPVSVQLRENSLESKKPKPVSQAKPRMENVDTNHIRKQIKDLSLDDSDTSSISSSETSSLFSPNKSLQFEGVFRRTLPTYSFTANRNPLSFGFKPNELPLKFPSLEQNAFAYKESNFSYYYNFSNANIISSFVAPKPFYHQSFIDNRHSPRNNRSPSPRTLDYSNCGEAQPKLNRNPSTPSLFVTFLHTFELTLFLIIILLLIVILSMPISLSLQSDFNNINLQILVSNISNP